MTDVDGPTVQGDVFVGSFAILPPGPPDAVAATEDKTAAGLRDRLCPLVQPVLSRRGRFRLAEPFEPWLPRQVHGGRSFEIAPTGDDGRSFFNGASVPPFAWWYLRPMDPRVVGAALVHDLLYDRKGRLPLDDFPPLSRLAADLWFFALMHHCKLGITRSWIAFITVATFGGYFVVGTWPSDPSEEANQVERQLCGHTVGCYRDKPVAVAAMHVVFVLMAATVFLRPTGWVAIVATFVTALTGSLLLLASAFWRIRLGQLAGRRP